MMKNVRKIVLAAASCLFAAGLAAGLAACNAPVRSSEKIFEDYSNVYDDTFEAEGIRIDGVLSEDAWEGQTQYERTSSVMNRELRYASVVLDDCTFTMTSVFGKEGLFLGAHTDDPVINCTATSVFSRTSIVVYLRLGSGLAAEFTFAADNARALRLLDEDVSSAYNLYPFRNVHSSVLVNEENGAVSGYTLECYIPWQTIGYDAVPDEVRMVGGLIRNTSEAANASMTWEQFGSGNGNVTYRNTGTWEPFDAQGYVVPAQGETFGVAGDYMPSDQFDVTNDVGEDACVLYSGSGTNHLYFKDFSATQFYAETYVQLLTGEGYVLGNDDPKVGFIVTGNRSAGSRQQVYAVAQLWENANNARTGSEVNRFRMAYRVENGSNQWTDANYSRNILNVIGSDMTYAPMKLALYRNGTQFFFFADDILVCKTQDYEYIPADLATYVGISSWNVPCKFTGYSVVTGDEAAEKYASLTQNAAFSPADNGGKYWFNGFSAANFHMSTTVSVRQGTDLSQSSRGSDLRAGLELWGENGGKLGVYVLFNKSGTLDRLQILPNEALEKDDYDWETMMANYTAENLKAMYPSRITDEALESGSYTLAVSRSEGAWRITLNGIQVAGTDISNATRIQALDTWLGGAQAALYGGINARSDGAGAAFAFTNSTVTTDSGNVQKAFATMNESRKDLSDKGVFGTAQSAAADAFHRNFFEADAKTGAITSYDISGSGNGAYMLYPSSLGTQFLIGTTVKGDPSQNTAGTNRQGLYFETAEGVGLLYAVVSDANVSAYNKLQILQYSVYGATLGAAVQQLTQADVEKYGAVWGGADGGTHELCVYRNGQKWYFQYNGVFLLSVATSTTGGPDSAAAALNIGEAAVSGGIYSRDLAAEFSENTCVRSTDAAEAYRQLNVFGGANDLDAAQRGLFAISGSTVTASTTTRSGSTIGSSQVGYLLYEEALGTQFYLETTVSEHDASKATATSNLRNGLYVTDGTQSIHFCLNDKAADGYDIVMVNHLNATSKNSLITSRSVSGTEGPYRLALYRNGTNWYFFLNDTLIFSLDSTTGEISSMGAGSLYGGIMLRNLPAIYTDNSYLTGNDAKDKFLELNVFGEPNGMDSNFRSYFTVSGSTAVATTTSTSVAKTPSYLLYEEALGTQFYLETTVTADTADANVTDGNLRNGLYLTNGTNSIYLCVQGAGNKHDAGITHAVVTYPASSGNLTLMAGKLNDLGLSSLTTFDSATKAQYRLAIYGNNGNFYFFINDTLVLTLDETSTGNAQTARGGLTGTLYGGIMFINLSATYENNCCLTGDDAQKKYEALTAPAQEAGGEAANA